jgi:hypothetical protein
MFRAAFRKAAVTMNALAKNRIDSFECLVDAGRLVMQAVRLVNLHARLFLSISARYAPFERKPLVGG